MRAPCLAGSQRRLLFSVGKKDGKKSRVAIARIFRDCGASGPDFEAAILPSVLLCSGGAYVVNLLNGSNVSIVLICHTFWS